MKRWIAHRVNRRLLETDAAGRIVRPGGAAQKRWEQPDRGDVTIIGRGDAFDAGFIFGMLDGRPLVGAVDVVRSQAPPLVLVPGRAIGKSG